MPHRPILWVGSARDDLRAFPDAARRPAGQQLDLLQQGLEPHDFKPGRYREILRQRSDR
jgi:phage-related protein